MKTTLLASSLLFLTATYAVAAPLAADQGQQRDVENRSEKAVENKGAYYSNKRSENAVEDKSDYYSNKRSENAVEDMSDYYSSNKRSENAVEATGDYYSKYGENKDHTKRSEMGVKNIASKYYENEKRSENGVKNMASKYYENEKRSENDVDAKNTKGHYYGYYKSKRAENSESEHNMA